MDCHMSNLTNACLPGFQLIGVQKSATSTLYNILRAHPQVKPAVRKELLWFNGRRCDPPERNPDAAAFRSYLNKFPKLLQGSGAVAAEFSAKYFHCWCCPAAFKRLMPNVRLIVQLRDPIERAKSHWAMRRAFDIKRHLGSFDAYVDHYLAPLQGCLASARGPSPEASSGYSLRASRCAGRDEILGESLYDDAMRNWLEHFQPKDILVTYLEQFAVEPEAVVSEIHAHLGLRNFTYPGDLLRRTYNKKGSYGWTKLAALQVGEVRETEVLQRLYDFYRPHMQKLKSIADAGRIAPLPPSWISRWGL